MWTSEQEVPSYEHDFTTLNPYTDPESSNSTPAKFQNLHNFKIYTSAIVMVAIPDNGLWLYRTKKNAQLRGVQ